MSWDPLAKPKLMAAHGRVVRQLADDEDEPANEPTQPDIPPFVAPDAKGDLRVTKLTKREPKMPRGVYDRTKVKAAAETTTKPARKTRKPRSAVVATSGSGQTPAPFGVALDLRVGAVTITAASGSLALLADEVAALFNMLRGRS